MKKFLLITFCLCCLASASAINYEFSYASPDHDTGMLGFEIADHYDVAIFVPGTGISDANATLTKVSAIVVDNSNVTNFKMWASKKLENPGLGMYVSGDIFNGTPEIEAIEGTCYKRITCTLSTPYKVDANGVYVGFSFDVKSIDKSNLTKYPVVITEEANGDNACMLRIARNSPAFMTKPNFSACITASFSGDFVENAARATVESCYVEKNKPITLNGVITNAGTAAVTSVDYECTIGETTSSGTIDLSLKARPGDQKNFSVTVSPIASPATYEGTFTITKVNTVQNQTLYPTDNFKVHVLELMTIHRPVMEEFTGTWCMWCPRGLAGIQKCKDVFGDPIIIAYHVRDIMALAENSVPECPQGLPCGWIDRTIYGDPYFGHDLVNIVPGAIVDDMRACEQVFAPANIEVKAEWNADNTGLIFTSTTTFAVVPDDGFNYRVSYVVTEDGLHGEGAEWEQINGLYKTQGQGEEYLGKYYDTPSPMKDMIYNEVAVFSSNVRGVNGSLPKTNDLEAGVPYEHTYEVALSKFVTKGGKQSYQNKCNMKVVAMLVKQDNDNGTIANANVCVIPEPAGVAAIADDTIVATEYYNLQGIKVANPQSGIYVEKAITSTGKTITRKVTK